MNFDLSEEQQMIVDQAAKFVANESPVERFRKLRDTERGWEPEMWAKIAEQGWLAIALPEEQGGFGGSFVDMALILEQLGRGLVPEPFVASVVLGGGLLSDLASDSQRESFLTPMIEGRTTLAFAYAETQSRYDLSDCLLSAKKSEAGWTLSGEKVWVLNGHAADQIIVAARTGGDQFDEVGLSLFIVDGEAEGLTRIRAPGMDGQRSALLRFEGVTVGGDRLLGCEGGAFAAIEKAVDRGAAAACAEGFGQVQELFERTVAYLKEREQFGVPIGSFQALQHKAADMYAETELCKSAMILASIQVDNPDEETRKAEVSAAKLQLSDGGWFVQATAIQLFGGIGVTDEQDEGLFFKRLRVLNGLFGDADWHVGRFQSLKGFDAID
ncbi:MAG: pimeloyl-CoA dehydrogenase small subunit [Deltaproteobacteria bacterium]|jgi:alkylation response protein AidB-like acyl-CoA dehydrogenase|nr:pimeloyl-CoA dehydrogenase small subunit [Deltaproteobacteria bacterium]